MQIFVKSLKSKIISFDINLCDTISKIKEEIQAREAIPIKQQRLVFSGKQLEDNKTFDNYNIKKESTLQLLLRLNGGAEITCIYDTPTVDLEKIPIFGEEFVKNNKNKCNIYFKGDKYELKSHFEKSQINSNNFEIILKINDDLNDLSYMFNNCQSLSSLPDIYKLNTSNVANMSHLFYNCNSLITLSDISKWDTSKVINMSHMFYCCLKLTSIPNISKWNTSKLEDISYMF